MKQARVLGVAVSIALGGFALASYADPAKELEVYKSSLGKFACNAKETGSGKQFKVTVEKTVEFDHTYVERYTEAKSADHPNPWNAVFLMSYDPASKTWVRNGVDNSGERNSGTSAGWQGDTWTWDVGGANIVIDRKGDNGFNFAVDVKQKEGGVKRVAEATCKRV
jgi:hypothetical protein